MGLLTGEKVDGVWRFTEEELGAFMDNPGVQQGLHTKRNSLVNDFLLMDTKKENHTCVILDFCMEWEDAKRVVAFFCDRIKEQGEEELRFGMERRKKNVRLILSGPEAAIKEIMKRYYEEN